MFPKMFRSSCVVSFSKETPDSSSFFFFPLSLFFPSNSVERNIRIPMNPFRVPKIEKSMFRGGKEKKKRKEKNKLKGKDFTGASRASGVFETCSKRVRTIQAGRIGAFIYSSRNSFVTRQTCKNTKIGIAFRNLVRRGY